MTRTQVVEKHIEYMPVIYLTGSLKELYMRGKRLCEDDHPSLLITGESGTGKELLAKSIHYTLSPASQFIPINCINLPYDHFQGKIEKHLAVARKDIAEQSGSADGCVPTIFFRDFGRLDPAVQKNLLKLIKEKITDLRKTRHEHAGRIRLIFSACQQDRNSEPRGAASSCETLLKAFNPELLSILPLRDRPADIQPLATLFADKYSKEYGKEIGGIHSAAISLLESHPWPNNVSELRDVIENAVLLAQHPLIMKEDIRFNISKKFIALESFLCREDFFTLDEIESIYIQTVLRRMNNNKSKTSKILGISRNTLQSKLDDIGVEPSGKAKTRKKTSRQPRLL